VTLDVDALLPESYVSEVGLRLSLYKRLASAMDEADVADVAAEMEDRFGEARARRGVSSSSCASRSSSAACARSAASHVEERHLAPARRHAARPREGEPPGRGQESLYKMTPDMRLTRKPAKGEPVRDGIELADRMLAELARCVRDEKRDARGAAPERGSPPCSGPLRVRACGRRERGLCAGAAGMAGVSDWRAFSCARVSQHSPEALPSGRRSLCPSASTPS